MVDVCLKAAEQLAEEGIDVCVIDLRTLQPWDTEAVLASVSHTHRLVTVEEGWGPFGIGAEIIAYVIEHALDELDAPPARVAGAFTPLPYAKNLEKEALPQASQIINAVRGLF